MKNLGVRLEAGDVGDGDCCKPVVLVMSGNQELACFSDASRAMNWINKNREILPFLTGSAPLNLPESVNEYPSQPRDRMD